MYVVAVAIDNNGFQTAKGRIVTFNTGFLVHSSTAACSRFALAMSPFIARDVRGLKDIRALHSEERQYLISHEHGQSMVDDDGSERRGESRPDFKFSKLHGLHSNHRMHHHDYAFRRNQSSPPHPSNLHPYHRQMNRPWTDSPALKIRHGHVSKPVRTDLFNSRA